MFRVLIISSSSHHRGCKSSLAFHIRAENNAKFSVEKECRDKRTYSRNWCSSPGMLWRSNKTRSDKRGLTAGTDAVHRGCGDGRTKHDLIKEDLQQELMQFTGDVVTVEQNTLWHYVNGQLWLPVRDWVFANSFTDILCTRLYKTTHTHTGTAVHQSTLVQSVH